MSNIILESVFSCPKCHFDKKEVMPLDACQYYYECTACHTLIKPLKGDCCVYCSFGTVKCASIQQKGVCCD